VTGKENLQHPAQPNLTEEKRHILCCMRKVFLRIDFRDHAVGIFLSEEVIYFCPFLSIDGAVTFASLHVNKISELNKPLPNDLKEIWRHRVVL
jgi:hypothetical protein